VRFRIKFKDVPSISLSLSLFITVIALSSELFFAPPSLVMVMRTTPVFNAMNLTYKPMKSVRPDIYQILPQEDLTKKICVHCGSAYFEYQNLGQLDCFIHPGIKIYDVVRGRFTYSCCGTDQSRGCLRVDHMDELLSHDDAQKREEALKAMAIMIMPQILTEFGYIRPRSENILMWLDAEPSQRLFLQRKWPYSSSSSSSSSQREKTISLNSEQAIAEMSEQLESQAYLKELLTLDRKEMTLKQEKRDKLNERWRTELNRNTGERVIKLNFVPLLVIRCLEI
jgi:hypothetical protein